MFATEYSVINDITNPRYPLFTAENPSDTDDLGSFEYDEITNENQYTEEEDVNVFLNFELPADFFGSGDGTIKFGGRGRFKGKFRDNDFFEIDLEDSFPTLADVPVKDYTDADFLAGSQYRAGRYADEVWLGRLDLSGGDAIQDEFLAENYDVTENIYAGYAMFDQNITDKLSVLAGLRLESTRVSSTGNLVVFDGEGDFDEEASGLTQDQSSYTNILPGVHFKYNISDNTILRLAWSNTLARAELCRSGLFCQHYQRGRGNTNWQPEPLDATISMNFDLMAEHYFKSVGLISGGLFYKDIDRLYLH